MKLDILGVNNYFADNTGRHNKNTVGPSGGWRLFAEILQT
jgi:hypothetical protein